MSAVLRTIAPLDDEAQSITQNERAQAVFWAARQAAACGGSWWVETHRGEEGEVWLGVVTPSSLGEALHSKTLTWLLSRQAEGIVLFSMPSGKTISVVRTIAEALTAIAQAERQRASCPATFEPAN